MFRLQGFVGIQQVEHFQAVLDTDVAKVDIEGLFQGGAGRGFVTQPHVDHSQFAVGADQLRHDANRFLEIVRRFGIAPHRIQAFGQRFVERSGVPVALEHLLDDFAHPRVGRIW